MKRKSLFFTTVALLAIVLSSASRPKQVNANMPIDPFCPSVCMKNGKYCFCYREIPNTKPAGKTSTRPSDRR
ncbi:hypothetical protein [Tenuifilum thalassicum]|uniref:Secreted protein n=1 Tax=Tenuifilum thalassicum TaxID=2590900 RepID=A0A7D4CAD5_9BACT|nr:hypothetical protein [Tenuifilum thalassicum]QKG80682.1 hypothetical protein FHG85_10530 [Tenuifilum thalassicum]